jgi:hypothetical protein
MIDVQGSIASQQVAMGLLSGVLVIALGALLWRGLAMVQSSMASPMRQPTSRARVIVVAIVVAIGLATFALPPLAPPSVALTGASLAAAVGFALIAAFPRSAKLIQGQVRTADITGSPSRARIRWVDIVMPAGLVLLCAAACAGMATPAFGWSDAVGLIHPSGDFVRYTPFPGWALALPMSAGVVAQVLAAQVALRRLARCPRVPGAVGAVAAADSAILGALIRGLSTLAAAATLAHLAMIVGLGLQAVSLRSGSASTLDELLQPSHAVGLALFVGGVIGLVISIGGILMAARTLLYPALRTPAPVPA